MRKRLRLWSLLVAVTMALMLAPPAHAVGFSDYMEKMIIDWIFKKTACPSVPTLLYMGLNSADPNDTGANELVVGTSPGYARAQLNPDTNNTTNTNWNADNIAGSGTSLLMSNKLALTFPQATGNWNSSNPITFWTLWDAASAGNCIAQGTITGAGVIVLNGNTLTFTGGTPGQLTFTVD